MLLHLAEQVQAQGVADDQQTVLDLIKYVVEHFGFEYLLMQQTSYPGIEDHHAKHQALCSRVVALKERIFAGEDVHAELGDLIDHWLRQHIQTADRLLADYLATTPS
jgi:hemerythrin-like metal-binding protein